METGYYMNPEGEKNLLAYRFAEQVIGLRGWIIVCTLLATFAAAFGATYLKPSSDYRAFFDPDNPELQELEFFESTYEKSDNVLIMIVPESGDAFSEDALAATIWLTNEAWLVPRVTRVDSLANFPHTIADDDGLNVQDLVRPTQISEAEAREKMRAIALNDPRLAGRLVARNGGVSAVNIAVALPEDDATTLALVANHTRDLAARAAEKFPGFEFRSVGTAIINQSYTEATIETTGTVLPASLAVMTLLMWVLTRSFAGVFATWCVFLITATAIIGIAGWLKIPFSTSVASAPIILLTLAVANCLHVILTFQEKFCEDTPKSRALIRATEINLYPIFLASMTTAFGFLMMNFSEVPPFRHLGTLVAIGSVISFMTSLTLLPSVLSFIRIQKRPTRYDWNGINHFADFVIHHRKALLWLSLFVVLGLTASVPRNELNDVLTEYFAENFQLRKDTDFLDAHLSGNTIIEYSISAGTPNGVAEPAFLEELNNFSDWLYKQPETRHVNILSDLMKQLNKSMFGDDPAAYRVPESRELAQQLLLLYELSLPIGLDVNNQIDVARSATRVTVTTRTLSTRDVLAFDERVIDWLENSTKLGQEVKSTGAAIMFAHLSDRNIRAILIGTIFAFVGVSAILMVAFRSPFHGFISLVPNFVPGLMAFGVWGLVVGEVGVVLSVILAMTIGIVVDDTVHFMTKYVHARRTLLYSPEVSVRYAFASVAPALAATTLILVAGFGVLGLSGFAPTGQMGQLTALVIALALACDFLFLPPLLISLEHLRDKLAKGINTT
ncbi:MAG: MMPL family transporter [Aestuariivita sp.]|nr:MMPL family transporter [Aestuariivita sp.]